MTASKGVVGLNTQIRLGDGESPEDFDLIPEAGDIDGPEVTQEFADFTHQQSSGGFHERKPTFKTSGQVTFPMTRVHGDSIQDALIAAATAVPAELSHFQLLYPDGTLVEFAAYPSIKFNAPMSGPFRMNVTLNLEGQFIVT